MVFAVAMGIDGFGNPCAALAWTTNLGDDLALAGEM
jgi:hypothetical protein